MRKISLWVDVPRSKSLYFSSLMYHHVSPENGVDICDNKYVIFNLEKLTEYKIMEKLFLFKNKNLNF